jgi:hypothetical protein
VKIEQRAATTELVAACVSACSAPVGDNVISMWLKDEGAEPVLNQAWCFKSTLSKRSGTHTPQRTLIIIPPRAKINWPPCHADGPLCIDKGEIGGGGCTFPMSKFWGCFSFNHIFFAFYKKNRF